jgi:hypothetical protein
MVVRPHLAGNHAQGKRTMQAGICPQEAGAPSPLQTPPFVTATGWRLRWDSLAVASLVLLCAACLLSGAGGGLRFAYPAAAFVVGAF